jgi:hypothetical protein
MSDTVPVADFVRSLLPPFLWQRDAEHGGVLAALVDAVAEDYDRLHAAIDRRYDDLFIATCDPGFIPRIGADIGLVGLAPQSAPGVGDRALVGRAIEVRRDKGTAAGMARAVRAATGWAVYVQDSSRCVARTAGLAGPPAAAERLVDLSDRRALSDLGQPWSTVARRPAIHGRPIGTGAGVGTADGPAVDGVTVGVWRLGAVPLIGRTPRAAADGPAGAYRCDPLGHDVALFDADVDAAEPDRRPRPLSMAALTEALGRGSSPVVVRVIDDLGRDRPARLAAADLSSWRSRRHVRADVLVDPTTGRLMPIDNRVVPYAVDYAVGAVGEIGGGPFSATRDLAAPAPGLRVWQVGRGDNQAPTLAAALFAWLAVAPDDALIELDTSATESMPDEGVTVVLAPGQRLCIWARDGAAPVLDGKVTVVLGDRAALDLRGLTIGGRLTAGGPGVLSLSHVTVAPRRRRRRVRLADGIALTAAYCVLGGLHGDRAGPTSIALTACIVDGSVTGLRSPAVLHLEQVTVLGKVAAGTVIAEDVIFAHGLRIRDREGSVVRTSFVAGLSTSPARQKGVEDTVGPVTFTSTRWPDAAFAQLALDGPPTLLVGASHGGEIGAFGWLDHSARLRRLTVVVPEMLPAGLEASVHFHT